MSPLFLHISLFGLLHILFCCAAYAWGGKQGALYAWALGCTVWLLWHFYRMAQFGRTLERSIDQEQPAPPPSGRCRTVRQAGRCGVAAEHHRPNRTASAAPAPPRADGQPVRPGRAGVAKHKRGACGSPLCFAFGRWRVPTVKNKGYFNGFHGVAPPYPRLGWQPVAKAAALL